MKSRPAILFSRALLLRCPACAGGPLFSSWFSLRPACPGCGLRLQREEGYYTGAMALNLIVAELLWVALFVGLLIATWPTPPWSLLMWGSIVLMVLLPVLFFPHSRTLWLAFDLLLRPVERREFRRPRDASQ
jgi:uncharacterized protein (DUF983 family)